MTDINEKGEDESDHEIAVNIPISDTTDVRVHVKPLGEGRLKSQRIHVRVNQKSPAVVKKTKSKHITYGSKGLVGHHLRKTRPPLFSRRPPTPKLERKEVIQKAVKEVLAQRRNVKEKEEKEDVNPSLDFQIRAQKILREKRTKNAQFKKMMEQL